MFWILKKKSDPPEEHWLEKAFCLVLPTAAAAARGSSPAPTTGQYQLGFIFIFLSPHKQAY